MGTEIAQQLEIYNQDYLLVSSHEGLQVANSTTTTIDYNNLIDFKQIITKQSKIQGIIYLWGLDNLDKTELTIEDIEKYQQRNCTSILNIIQTLFAQSIVAPLWLVTRNNHTVETESLSPPNENSILSNSLWGLGKVIASEHPEYYGGIIDLSRKRQATEANTILGIINNSHQEDYLAIRQENIYVPRLVKAQSINHKPLKN